MFGRGGAVALWAMAVSCAGDAPEVCFPGPQGNGNQCVPVVPVADLRGDVSDFEYPDPLGGSAQYARPLRFLDLSTVSPDLQVARNFQLSELAQEEKGRYAIVQSHAVGHIQAVRTELGEPLRVNSGYRSPGYNAGIPGSATYSRHTYGDAFDLAPPSGVSLTDLEAACSAKGASFTRLYETHVHCDWRDDALDQGYFGVVVGPARAPDVTSSYRVADELELEAAWVEPVDGVLTAPAEGWPEGEPLREWTAFDKNGWIMDEAVSRTYLPPAGAAWVEVVIGRHLVRTWSPASE